MWSVLRSWGVKWWAAGKPNCGMRVWLQVRGRCSGAGDGDGDEEQIATQKWTFACQFLLQRRHRRRFVVAAQRRRRRPHFRRRRLHTRFPYRRMDGFLLSSLLPLSIEVSSIVRRSGMLLMHIQALDLEMEYCEEMATDFGRRIF